MRKILISGTIICVLSLSATHVHARLSKEYLSWMKGEFEIPEEIKNVINVSELQPFIESNREFTRMAAIRRLGQIEGPKAIGPLREVFAKEPSPKGLHEVPLVKFEVIRTLGRIGTKQAKSILLDILKDYWNRGPNVKDKKGFRLDRDFATVMPLVLETLYKWSADKDVFETVKIIALSEDVKNLYSGRNSIGQRAWEVYLRGKMIKDEIVEEKDSTIYLLNFIEDIAKEGAAYGTLGFVKKIAAYAILKKHSEAVLSSMVSEFEEQFKKEPRTPKGFFTERHNILRRNIGTIKKILKEKKEKEEMKKKEEMKEKSGKK